MNSARLARSVSVSWKACWRRRWPRRVFCTATLVCAAKASKRWRSSVSNVPTSLKRLATTSVPSSMPSPCSSVAMASRYPSSASHFRSSGSDVDWVTMRPRLVSSRSGTKRSRRSVLSALSKLSLEPRELLIVRQDPVPVATGSRHTVAMSARNTLQSWSSSFRDGGAIRAGALEHVARTRRGTAGAGASDVRACRARRTPRSQRAESPEATAPSTHGSAATPRTTRPRLQSANPPTSTIMVGWIHWLRDSRPSASEIASTVRARPSNDAADMNSSTHSHVTTSSH